jgi:hypothetical protein
VDFIRSFVQSRYSEAYLLMGWSESKVQGEIVRHLKARFNPVRVIDSGAKQLRASSGGFSGGAGAAASGVPDVTAVLPGGRALWLEIKAPAWIEPGKAKKYRQVRAAGKPSTEQLHFLDAAAAAGAVVGIAWHLNDVIEILERFGY